MGDLLCAIHQPNFFPWLSTLAKLFTADIWIVLDDVQFTRRDYQHRCRVAGPDGIQRWLTVPVHLPAGRATLIRDVLVAGPGQARNRISDIIRRDYRTSPCWPDVRDLIAEVREEFARSDRLAEISEASTLALLRALRWTGTTYRSSDLPARPGRSQHLADLTVAAGAGSGTVPGPAARLPRPLSAPADFCSCTGIRELTQVQRRAAHARFRLTEPSRRSASCSPVLVMSAYTLFRGSSTNRTPGCWWRMISTRRTHAVYTAPRNAVMVAARTQ